MTTDGPVTGTHDILGELAVRLRPIFERHRVLRVVAFGSLARGEASRRSDVDLLIVQDTPKPFLDRYGDLLREVVQAVPGRDVDILVYTPQEIDQLANRQLIATALNEGKTIYESHQEPAPG